MIKGNSKEEVDNAETITKTFIRNKMKETTNYWKRRALKYEEDDGQEKKFRPNNIAGEYVEDTTDEKKPAINDETEEGKCPSTCQSPTLVKDNKALKERLQTLEKLSQKKIF